MKNVSSNPPPANEEIEKFVAETDFQLPVGFIDFYKEANGADIRLDDNYVVLWALTELIELNEAYKVKEYAPDYLIFGSNGGDTAYCFEKSSGHIFEMPFIGMSKEEAIFKCHTFKEFMKNL